MKKKIIAAMMASVMCSAVSAKGIPVQVNDSGILESYAVSDGGQLYLPLHDIAYISGERVRYSVDNDNAYLSADGKEYVCFYIDSQDDSFKNQQYKAKLIDGGFYISSADYVKIFGGSVAWDKEENKVDITEKDYCFGLDEIMLFRPAETVVKTNPDGSISVEVCEEYSETMQLNKGEGSYEKEVEEGRIPVVSILKTYYGIDYNITQGFKKRPVATVKLTRGNETYIYTIHFKECSD